jgi:hypothetical protein
LRRDAGARADGIQNEANRAEREARRRDDAPIAKSRRGPDARCAPMPASEK